LTRKKSNPFIRTNLCLSFPAENLCHWNGACSFQINMKADNTNPAPIKFGQDTRVVILTGAGISAESGIRTFRDSGGLWENHKIEDVATPGGFAKDPILVWDFYHQRFQDAQSATPNAGHQALAQLESKLQNNFHIITQNVDGLHRRAGNHNVIEMHGRLDKCYCTLCGSRFDLQKITFEDGLPFCPECEGLLRPDIVWFGEIPYGLDKIDKLVRTCDVFIVIGTSGVVYPAAGLVLTARYNGAVTLGINLEPPENMFSFDEFYTGKAGEVLPNLVHTWLS
jgi:NAD-dependent deacetylase